MSGETGRTMVIGIAGGTGSGKTTVTRKIKEYFGEDVSVIYHDSYYKRHDELVYDYSIYNRTGETEEVRPTKVVIAEGILIFQDPRLREQMDIKIFVDTDADTRILRRILRDVKERGRTLESVIGQYLPTVKPMHEQYVQPSRKYADIVMLEGGHNLVALDMIIQRIRSHVEGT